MRELVIQYINKSSASEIEFILNHILMEMLEVKKDVPKMSQVDERVLINNFSLGDTVSYPCSDGVIRFGKVVKINKTTLHIKCVDAEWKAPPSILTKIRKAA